MSHSAGKRKRSDSEMSLNSVWSPPYTFFERAFSGAVFAQSDSLDRPFMDPDCRPKRPRTRLAHPHAAHSQSQLIQSASIHHRRALEDQASRRRASVSLKDVEMKRVHFEDELEEEAEPLVKSESDMS